MIYVSIFVGIIVLVGYSACWLSGTISQEEEKRDAVSHR